SSKPIGESDIDERNAFGGRRLLQESTRKEASEVQGCQEMLADCPTNLQIGLAADVARITKVRRPQLHVLKAIECIVRALTPEPDPTEVSGHVLQRMEPKLWLNSEQICRPDQCELRTEISSSRKHRVECSQCIRLALVSAEGIGLETEPHAPHRTRKRPANISSRAPCTDRAIPERTPLEPSLNVVIKTCPGRLARQAIEIPPSN